MIRVTDATKDIHGKTLADARVEAQRDANRVGAARGERVATLGRLWHSARRFSYGVGFNLPGDIQVRTFQDRSVIEDLEQFLPQ
jgi:hypothetical protein